jgi:cysteine desulfurase
MTGSLVYVDNNATTSIAPEVLEAMLPYLTERYGNPSSLYRFGGSVHADMEQARGHVAELIGASDTEIVFTSCGTESDTTAILSALATAPDRRHIVTTAVEHPAIIGLCEYLETAGYAVTYLPVDEQGRLDLEQLSDAISDQTAIVSIMHANNETGVIFPLDEVAAIVKQRGCLLHTDAVQSVGKLPLDLRNTPVDFLSLSGHKLHAPKGVGALYIRKNTPYKPLLMGGHQERNLRAGTENVASIVGLGRAAQLASEHMEDEQTRVRELRDRLQEGLIAACPDTRVNGADASRLPNTLHISFGYIEGESITLLLDELGICVSTGSACSTGSLEISHVIDAMQVPPMYAHGSIRFSLSRYNTDAEVDYILEQVPPMIARLREMSPYGHE